MRKEAQGQPAHERKHAHSYLGCFSPCLWKLTLTGLRSTRSCISAWAPPSFGHWLWVCLPPRGVWRCGRPSGASAACSPWLHIHPLWCRTHPPAFRPRREQLPGCHSQERRLHRLPHPRSAASWTSSSLRILTRTHKVNPAEALGSPALTSRRSGGPGCNWTSPAPTTPSLEPLCTSGVLSLTLST